jgi:Zn-finger nucleic acid-binding protein
MTDAQCLAKVCGSPDVSCPGCGKTMSVWIKEDMPIYRCDQCNGIAFPLDRPKLESALKKAKDRAVSEMTCSGCGQNLIELRSEDYMLDSCHGCSMIFARPKAEHWENEPDSTNGRYQAVLSWLAEVYDQVNASL